MFENTAHLSLWWKHGAGQYNCSNAGCDYPGESDLSLNTHILNLRNWSGLGGCGDAASFREWTTSPGLMEASKIWNRSFLLTGLLHLHLPTKKLWKYDKRLAFPHLGANKANMLCRWGETRTRYLGGADAEGGFSGVWALARREGRTRERTKNRLGQAARQWQRDVRGVPLLWGDRTYLIAITVLTVTELKVISEHAGMEGAETVHKWKSCLVASSRIYIEKAVNETKERWDRHHFYLCIECLIFLETLRSLIWTQKLVQSKLCTISRLNLSHVLSMKSGTTSSTRDLLPALSSQGHTNQPNNNRNKQCRKNTRRIHPSFLPQSPITGIHD